MKIVIFLMMFLLIGAFFIVANDNLYLKNPEQRAQFAKSYYGWFEKVFTNTRTISGYAINLDWLP